MNFKQFTLKIKGYKFEKQHLIYLLYQIACVSIIIQFALGTVEFALISGLILIAAVLIRITLVVLKKKNIIRTEKESIDWKALRQQLTQILSESKILLDTAVELKRDETSTIIHTEQQVNGSFFKENEELIQETREIGIDGLLSLMFLIQQQPAVASVRAIQKSLKIPLASVYRHLQKLTNKQLVITYYVTDKPSKALYKITDEGSSLIIKLYELIGGSLLPIHEDIKTNVPLDVAESEI